MNSPASPRGIILLCAGRGTRMRPLTDHVPKCLLRMGDRLVIDHLLDAILARTEGEVVAVTGFAADRVRDHLADHHGSRVTTAHNDRFEADVNILSVETGVSALRHPQQGYVVVETDLLLDTVAWDHVFAAAAGPDSFWACKGYYSKELTGGIVHADEEGQIDAVEYRPEYDANYDGWPKMVGVLGVAPAQVSADRQFRQAAIADTVTQYYLMPWRRHLPDLPCKVLQMDDCFAQSFNTTDDFTDTCKHFLALSAAARPMEFS